MGIVYEAEDLTLHWHVALKFLPSSVAASEPDRARLLQEERAASGIDHPISTTRNFSLLVRMRSCKKQAKPWSGSKKPRMTDYPATPCSGVIPT